MPTELLRIGAALLFAALLAFWTWRRAKGSGEDPALSFGAGDGVASLSFLASGLAAVVLVAVGLIIVLGPMIQETPGIGVIIVAIVLVHAWLEYEESGA